MGDRKLYGARVCVSLARCAAVLWLASGLFAESKAEIKVLRAQLAEAKAQTAAKIKENATLQAELQVAAVSATQLAAALRDKKALQASIDALMLRDKTAQQEATRAATQAGVAAQAASQITAQTALRNKTELAHLVKAVKVQADNTARSAANVVATNSEAITEVKGAVNGAVSATNDVGAKVTKVGDKMDDMALRIEETKQAAHHANLLLILAAFSPVTLPLVQFLLGKLSPTQKEKT